MTICLLAAWVVVCLAMIKGIQSSGKVSMLEPLLLLLITTPACDAHLKLRCKCLWANNKYHVILGSYIKIGEKWYFKKCV